MSTTNRSIDAYRDEYLALRIRERYTPAQTRAQLHIHPREAAELEREVQGWVQARADNGHPVHLPDDKQGTPDDDPFAPDELSNEALRSLEDFSYFRTRYLGRKPTPWQVEAAGLVRTLLDRNTEDKEYVTINLPPGSGKPVSVDALVLMADGSRKRLGDIIVGDWVITHTGQPARVAETHDQGLLDTVLVQDGWGREVIAAPDHGFLTEEEGWQKASALAGLTAPFVLAPTIITGSYWSLDAMAMAGYFVGDGSTIGNFCITNADPDIVADICACAARMGWPAADIRARNRCVSVVKFGEMKGNRRGIAMEWLRTTGLRGCDSRAKRVPPQVFQAPPSHIARFVAAYFDCDGYVDARGQTISFNSVSRELLADVQHLLLRLGIRSGIVVKWGHYNGEPHKSWNLNVHDRTAFRALIPVVGIKRERISLAKDPNPKYAGRARSRAISVSQRHAPILRECRCLTIDHSDQSFVANDFPVHNSTTFTHDIPLFMAVRNRAIRVMIGSYTERQAVQYVTRLRRSFTRRAVAQDAESTLVKDFGGFRPLERDIWRTNEFVISQYGEIDYSEKEASFAAYGLDSAFLGGRFDLVIWDDLVDKHVLRTPKAIENLEHWFVTEAMTRLEPGGLFILQGQRMAPHDLYRFSLNLKHEDGTPRFRHVVYKAHDEERCKGEHSTKAPYWPEGCLLDPVRVSWREQTAVRRQSHSNYETLYQQQDLDESVSLVRQIWLDGGTEDNVSYPGCWDKRRRKGQLPDDHTLLNGVITVDPSPTNNWAVQLWAISPETEHRYLIDVWNGPLQISEFLDYSFTTLEYSGILETWYRQYAMLGMPIRFLVVEVNSGQRWLLQSRHYQQWAATRGIAAVAHTTTMKKSDPEYGVQALGPLFKHGKVRLPGLGEDQHIQTFVNQHLQWPNAKHDDQVMAHWFIETQWQNVAVKFNRTPALWRPSWMKPVERGLRVS